MKQSSKRTVSVLVALLCIVGSFIVLLDFIEPEYTAMTMIKAKYLGEESYLASEQNAVSQIKNLLVSYTTESQSQNAESIALAIPNTQDLAGALAQIYGLGQANNVSVETIGVSAPSISATSASTPATTGGIESLNTISFQVNGAGTYEALKNFLAGLETNVRVFDLKSFSMSPEAQAGSKSSGDYFTYSFSIATYYQSN